MCVCVCICVEKRERRKDGEQERDGGGRRSTELSIHSRSWGFLSPSLRNVFATFEVRESFDSVNHHLPSLHEVLLSGWKNVAAK